MTFIDGKSVLVTGGTGSFGKEFIRTVLEEHNPRRVIVFSRDELKQYEMRRLFPEKTYPAIRYFIGDVRDRDRLDMALRDVEIVVHAAALKQVVTAEYNPLEVIKTNVMGAANLIGAAIEREVERVVALSTDKAANPVNLYGATKLCADKLFVAAESYVGKAPTRFSVVRYGNVMGSRGSVIPFFLKEREKGVLPITDERMTRFWITLDQGVELVLDALDLMRGGEIFVPRIPSMRIVDLARTIAPDAELETVGIRPGEKLHEVLVTEDEARRAIEADGRFVILPHDVDLGSVDDRYGTPSKECDPGFVYSSDSNDEWLSPTDLKDMIGL